MKWRDIENNWELFKVIIQQHWSKVSYQQLETVAGKRAQLSHMIQSAYGISSSMAEYQVTQWQESILNIDGQFYTAQSECVKSLETSD